MTPKDLTKLVRFARKQGLKFLKCGEIEFEFSTPPQPKQRRTATGIGEPLANDFRAPTEDEMLMWSTETFDQMRAQREDAAKEKN